MSALSRPRPLAPHRALLARARLGARRLRLTRWAAAALLGAAVAASASDIVADAEARRDRWSTVGDVWVLAADLAAGSILEPDDLQRLVLPAIAVPDDAVPVDAGSPVGRRLRVAGHRGEIVLGPRLAPAGASAVASRLPDGTRGITVPVAESEPLEVGDEADLFDVVTGRPLVAEALVVAAEPGAVTVAVTVGRIGPVISALAGGGVVTALVP